MGRTRIKTHPENSGNNNYASRHQARPTLFGPGHRPTLFGPTSPLVEYNIQNLDDIAGLDLPIPKRLELRRVFLTKKHQMSKEAKEAEVARLLQRGTFIDDHNQNFKKKQRLRTKIEETKRKINSSFRNFKEDASELSSYLVLWNRDIHDIGCHFGNIIRNYFIFIRNLMSLNMVVGIFYCYFLILPEKRKMELKYSNGIECIGEVQNSGSGSSSGSGSGSGYMPSYVKSNFNLRNVNTDISKNETCNERSSESVVVQPYHYLFSNFSFESLTENSLARNHSIELERNYPPLGGYRFPELENPSLNIQKINSSDDLHCYQEINSIGGTKLPTFAGKYEPFTIPSLVKISDFMSGTGSTENSAWFAGYHQPVKGDQSMTVPFAYIGIQVVGFIICLRYLLNRIVKGKSKGKTVVNAIKTNESGEIIKKRKIKMKTTYINLTFAAWDFSINDKTTANLRKKKICGLLMEELKADLAAQARGDKTKNQKVWLFVKRIIVWSSFISYLFTGVWSIQWSVMGAGKWATDGSDKSDMPDWLTWFDTNVTFFSFVDWLPQFSLMIVSGVGPTLFKLLGGLEEYSEAKRFKMLILRNSLTKLLSIFVLVLSIIIPFQCEVKWPVFLTKFINSENHLNGTLTLYEQGSSYNNTCLTCTPKPTCWENEIGREMYKIVVIDGIKQIFIDYLIIDNLRAVVSHTFHKPAIKGEFDIMRSVLQIIHIQCMTWIGMFFCPILPIVMGVLMIVEFYTQKHTLFKLKKAPKRYRFKSSSFFNRIMLIFYCLAFMIFMLTLFVLRPSYYCGPMAFNRQLPISDPSITRAYADAVAGYFSLDTSNWNSILRDPQLLVVFVIIFMEVCEIADKAYKKLSATYYFKMMRKGSLGPKIRRFLKQNGGKVIEKFSKISKKLMKLNVFGPGKRKKNKQKSKKKNKNRVNQIDSLT